MAQTASAITFKDCKVEFSTDGSTTWVDCSGFATEVAIDGGERITANAYTFDGDVAIIGKGKREPVSITATMVYTEGATDAFSQLMPYFESTAGSSSISLRWTPKGLITGTTGENQFTSQYAGSVLKHIEYPNGSAESADPVVIRVVVESPAISRGTSAT